MKSLDQRFFEDDCNTILKIGKGGGNFKSGKTTLNVTTSQYSINLDCSITLTANNGRHVLITWKYFDVEQNTDGSCRDTLTIYDGSSESGIILNDKKCGRYRSIYLDSRYPSAVSTGNVMTVRLVTDYVYSIGAKRDFQFTYTSFRMAGKILKVYFYKSKFLVNLTVVNSWKCIRALRCR